VEPRPEQLSEAALVRDVFFVIFKRKYVLLALLLLGLGIIGFGMATKSVTYEARARVMLRRKGTSFEMPLESRVVLKREEEASSELEIIKSSSVAELVVDRLGLAEGKNRAMVVYRLQKRLRAENPSQSNIIDITYKDISPERAERVTNAALDAYLEVRKNVALDYDAVRYLDEQVARVSASSESLANRLATLRGDYNQLHEGLRAEQQQTLTYRFENDVAELTSKVAAKEKKLALVDEWLKSGGDPSAAPSRDIYEMYSVRQAKTELTNLKIRMASARSRYPEDHPEVRTLGRQIVEAQTLLRSEVEYALEMQRMRLEEWKADRDGEQQMLDALHAEDSSVAHQRMAIRLLEDRLSKKLGTLEMLRSHREQYRITAATDPALMNVGVVARATIPAVPAPEPVNMRVVVGIFTVIFGIMLAFLLERLDHSVERREDAERHLGYRVLASIPERRR